MTAGTADGGTMQYALGTDAATAPTTGYSASIPTATNAGTYYVWYKAVGDATHTESAAGCVAVEIKKAKAVVTVAPVAVPGLIWTGAPQALVSAGTADEYQSKEYLLKMTDRPALSLDFADEK